jgi:hypothetical protein
MLSNFQYGNQALLQSFLVGQPEFREILQRPELEQFRQRVSATCHIGPLDSEETKAYIEHRLKCAGATDKPSFDPEVFDTIHQAARGIPRQINALCDRLLLLGFLCDRTHLTLGDVQEVIREFAQEAEVPQRSTDAAAAAHSGNGKAAPVDAELPVDLSRLRLDPGLVKSLTPQIDALGADQHIDQLQRLERSVLRLERVNVQTLGMLKKLVSAVKKSSNEPGK